MIEFLKPYQTYKDSGFKQLGEVPEHWRAAPLRRYCTVFAGATPSRAKPQFWRNGSIPWLSSGDVNLRTIGKARQFITKEGLDNSSTRWIRPNSLVLALAGQGKTKGMVATVEFATTCNQSLAAIEPNSSESKFDYLAYYLESQYQQIRALVGDGLRDGLNLEHVKSILTPLPTLVEQTAIVRFLDHTINQIDRLIQANEKLIELLRELKQSTIHEAVTGRFDVRIGKPYAKYKDSGVEWLGDVPEHWGVRSLKRLCSQSALYGANLPASTYTTNGIRFLRTTDITEDGKLQRDGVFVTRSLVTEYILENGDLLLSRSGSIGRSFLHDREKHGTCAYAGYLVRFVPQSRISAQFLYFFTLSGAFTGFLRTSAISSTIENVNGQKYANCPFTVPPFNEQIAIARFLNLTTNQIEQAIGARAKNIELLKEYRTRLIADAVTGKIDVRAIAADLTDSSLKQVNESNRSESNKPKTI